MILKAIDRILWLTYGNHGSSSESREDAEVLLEALSNTDEMKRSELMQQIGLDEEVDKDVREFNNRIKPLKGLKSSNPLSAVFVLSTNRDGDSYCRLSRGAFESWLLELKKEAADFVARYRGEEVPGARTLEKLVWIAYANHSNTYQHRQNAREVLKYLIENGEASKQELMSHVGLEYGDENDDQRFRGMMQYLRASWEDEEDARNPLHTSSHGFLVSRKTKGREVYYETSMREFKSSMNVVAGNIRSFLR